MNRILVPIDDSANARAAARLAADIARANAAPITLYHAIASLDHLLLSKSLTRVYVLDRIAAWEAKLDAVKELLVSQADLDVECVVEKAEATSGILRQAAELSAQLIVLGAHGDTDDSLLFGSVSTKVARDASLPVLVVRTDQSERFPADGVFRRPVVAVDYSKFSLPAITLAAALTRSNEPIELIHVYLAPDIENDTALASALADVRGRELERLKEFGERTDIAPVAIKTRVEGGRISSELLDYIANSETDLVVIGAHGRTDGVAILGTSADRIIRQSAAPVLVIPDAAIEADKPAGGPQ